MKKFMLFNEKVKNEFLNIYSGTSRLTYTYILTKSYTTEEIYNKDLYDFSIKEIEEVMYKINPINLSSSIRYAGVIKSYIDWAAISGHKGSNIGNPLDVVTKEWYQQFVEGNKTLITEQELLEIEEGLVNYQDKMPLRLAFEGVAGEDMSEQANLTRNSFSFDSNVLKLKDNVKGEREIEVSDYCKSMIEKTFSEDVYQLKNGLSEGKVKERQILETGYLLRDPGLSTENKPISKFNLYKRLRNIKEWFDYPLLSYKNLQRSGMIKMAVDLYEERGVLGREEYDLIAEKYNVTKIKVNGKEYYPMSKMKGFLNRESILELYGIDIDK